MTCIEKLRELHPEWSEEEIEDGVLTLCPSDFGIRWERCWDTEMEE